MEELRIRASTREDIPGVSGVLAASWKSAYRGIVDDGYLDALEEDRWVPLLRDDRQNGAHCMVAEAKDRLIGASIYRRSVQEGYFEDGEIVALYLLPDWMGNGVGSRLCAAVETDLRDMGFAHCILDVLDGNRRARRFYQSRGFADVGEVPVTLDRVYMCRMLRKRL